MDADAGMDEMGHSADGGGSSTPDGPAADTGPGSADQPDAQRLARDWITLWQSELSALAADPEIRESWQAVWAVWAGTMSAMLRGLPRDTHDGPARKARAADAPRAAPAAAAPDARDAEIERLARHVAALERRLAELERGGGAGVDPASRPRRKPRG
ncbi:MAG TPA: hypothetical protein PLD10_09790 [Rhodopila sp.]|nr:hypothetical protein [Rhodopila sp.]